MKITQEKKFQKLIWDYYRAHPRPMPWRRARDRRDPYRILVSEIMLQQTQVARVVPFYENFIKKFPDFRTLAKAKTPAVLQAWQGLGYNRRALALQKLAREVVAKYSGRLPRDRAALESLSGIGPYTAGAIRAFAFNEPEVFIETNIRRVFIHFFFPLGDSTREKSETPDEKVTDAAISRYIERTLDVKNPCEWYWALMDYGAMLGESVRSGLRNEQGMQNPNRRSAHYLKQSKFVGSDREIRGKILREILAKNLTSKNKAKHKLTMAQFAANLHQSPEKMRKIIDGLVRDGFLLKNGKYIEIAK